MKRRGFLGGLVASLAARPKVDAAAIEQAMGIGEAIAPLQPFPGSGYIHGGPHPVASEHIAGSWHFEQITRLKVLKKLKPSWWLSARQSQAKHIHAFDPDIASFQSVSPAAKRQMQIDRNFDKYLENEERMFWERYQEEIFKA